MEVKAIRKQQSTSETMSMSGFKIQLLFKQLGASCNAETKPILINPCRQEHLAMHLPEGLDADLNNEVLHTIHETASGPEVFSFPKTKCL